MKSAKAASSKTKKTAASAPAPSGRSSVFTFVARDGGETAYDLASLLPRVTTIATRLKMGARPGSVVGLIFRSEPVLVAAWLACLHAGLRPLVMQYPTRKQTRAYWLDSVRNTIERAGLAALICDSTVAGSDLADQLTTLVLPSIEAIEPAAKPVSAVLPDDFAIVQLSSGTTGYRKAVEFRSDHLRRHVADYNATLNLAPGKDVIASWLPLYHDMGYVACFVMPIILGVDVVMMDPMDWVAEPTLLFDAIERHKASVAYMPNFGFEVLSRKAARKLPSMRWWVSCSEPVSAQTSARFIEHIGADPDSFAPCYAMAENIFAVSIARGLKVAPIDDRDVVSCGRPIGGVEMKAVEGEIWVKSPTSLERYMGGDDIRDADGFYPTGDLGEIIDGELYVTGRKQDLIIQAGRKFMLSDIDLAVNRSYAEVRGRVAAVQTYDERLGTQKPLVLIEAPDFFQRTDNAAYADTIRTEMNIDQVDVAFVPPRFLTKTSSGKINRKTSGKDYARATAPKDGASSGPSLESELKKSFAHADWQAPVSKIFDSLSLTVLRIILNDCGVAYDPDATLAAHLAKAKPEANAAMAGGEHVYIVMIGDSRTMRYLEQRHIELLARRFRKPVVFEAICLPPAAIVLSDLIFQDWFLPRIEDREPFSVVERILNKLRRASVIICDDVAEMMFPPLQVYGVLSHAFERSAEADQITVRWQRYAQNHHLLPLTVVSGCDMPLANRTADTALLGKYLDTPVYRVASLEGFAAQTVGWEYRAFERKPPRMGERVFVQPGDFVAQFLDWVSRLPGKLKTAPGAPESRLDNADLAHFCSRIVNADAVDKVLDQFDSFAIIGQDSSLPFIEKRLDAMGKRHARAPSYAPDVLAALPQPVDCLLICGAQGKYEITKPAVALMAADPGRQTWNMPDQRFDQEVFIRPPRLAPPSGQDWYHAHPLDRSDEGDRLAVAGVREGSSRFKAFVREQRTKRVDQRDRQARAQARREAALGDVAE
jgi:acyl-CoA synthetase (AMP-forming)/AMP-acid ligase II